MNTTQIRELHRKVCTQLLARQEEKHVVESVGDIMCKFVDDFEIYVDYCRGEPQAQYLLSTEKQLNPGFAAFLEVCLSRTEWADFVGDPESPESTEIRL